MAAQVFAPLFIVLRTHDDKQITINTSTIQTFEPAIRPDEPIIWCKHGQYMNVTVKRSFQDLNNDLAAKNCK